MVSNDHFGGHLEFRRMANGAWVVGRWWIRMPSWGDPPARRFIGASERTLGGNFRERRAKADGLRVREQGGEIVFMAQPRSLDEGTAGLDGTVWDSVRARPLAGATVFLADLGRAVRTDGLGRYRMSDLPAGHHTLGFFHPFTDSLQLRAVTRPVDLVAGKHNTADLAVPAAAGCRPGPSTAIVVGFVESVQSGEPVARVSVVGTWRDPMGGDPAEHLASTDARGRYQFCGVPVGEPLKLETAVGRPLDLGLQSPGIYSEDLISGRPRF
jgi:hypothetical protein